MKIRIAPIVVAALAVLALAGCTISPPSSERAEVVDGQGFSNFGVEEFRHILSDGREVTCLFVYSGSVESGGTSCDWDNAE